MGSIIDNAHDQQQDASREASSTAQSTSTTATPAAAPAAELKQPQAATYAPAPVENPNESTVELDEPLQRGATTITHVTVRKPGSGALRGVALVDLLNLDVNALHKVLPRITTPALTEHEARLLDPADLVELGSKVAGFLVRKSVKAEAFLTA